MPNTIHQSFVTREILLLEIDNPPSNSLSKTLKDQFLKIISEIKSNSKLRAVIISGRGTKFCTGDDLKQAIINAKKGDDYIIDNLKRFGEIIEAFDSITIPTIAAINGWCVGGGLELALCCDIRIACDEAQFVAAGVNVGLLASTYRLPNVIGKSRAKAMLLTAKKIDSSTALQYGLIEEIITKEELLGRSVEMAKTIALKAPLSIKMTKFLMKESNNKSNEELAQLNEEKLLILAKSSDYKEALLAFEEKRKPIFRGE